MTTIAEAVQKELFPGMSHQELSAEGPSSDPSFIYIDVRTPSEFEEAHILNSRNIPLADLNKFFQELQELAKGKTLILLCRTGNRVQIAHDYLVNNGVTNCRILEGGISKWIADGNPVVRGRKGYSLERQTRIIAGFLVMVGVALGATLNPWYLLLPAAVGAGLFHAGLTDSCFMGIMLGKLPFNRR